MAWQDAPSGWAPVGDYTGLGGGGGGPGVFPSSPGGFPGGGGGGGSSSPWGTALDLASRFLGGGSSKGGGSSNVDKGGYLNQAKKEAKTQDTMKQIFPNFSIYKEAWEPQSNPQQFAQQYAASGGGSSGGGGNKAMSVLGGAATGAQLGSIIPGVGTVVGAIGGGLAGLFCDVRLKTDIAPLERSDVHDELAEMAFLVKEIRECA